MPPKETLQEEQLSRLPLKGKSLLPSVQRGIGSIQHVHPYVLHIYFEHGQWHLCSGKQRDS